MMGGFNFDLDQIRKAEEISIKASEDEGMNSVRRKIFTFFTLFFLKDGNFKRAERILEKNVVLKKMMEREKLNTKEVERRIEEINNSIIVEDRENPEKTQSPLEPLVVRE